MMMKTILLTFSLLLCGLCLAQPPKRPLQPYNSYSLPGYHATDPASALILPEGLQYTQVSSIALTRSGNLLVLQRGAQPFLEFDPEGNFLRAFGENLKLEFAHGLNIDKAGNIWVTDLFSHLVYKLDANANILMTLGTAGVAGEWNEARGEHLFFQPNETAIDSAGNLYVVQGHGIDNGAGQPLPMVLKFSADGKFIRQWGGLGEGPGKFAVAHSIKIDAEDNLYVADRENQRIQIFDTEGTFQNAWTYSAMVCAIYLHQDGYLYMTSGFDGEFAKVDMHDGAILGSLGSPGDGIGQFGEGHFLTLDAQNNIYIADVRNRRVQIYTKD